MPPSFNMWMMATVSSPFSLLLELPTYILSLEFCSENNLSKTQIWSCFHIIHFLLRALQRFFTDLRIKFDLNKRSRPFMIYLLPQTVFVTTSLKNMMTQKKPSPHYERSRRTFSVFQLQGTTCFNLIVPCFFSSISFVWKVTPVCCALTSPATFTCIIPTCLQNSNETSPSMESLPDHAQGEVMSYNNILCLHNIIVLHDFYGDCLLEYQILEAKSCVLFMKS